MVSVAVQDTEQFPGVAGFVSFPAGPDQLVPGAGLHQVAAPHVGPAARLGPQRHRPAGQ